MSAPTRLFMTADAVGGVWQYALELARGLAPLGFETTLALLGPAPGSVRRAEAQGVRLIETGLPLDWLAADAGAVRAAARAVAALARDEGAELIQLNQPALAAEPMPAPTVAAAHSCVATWWRAVRGHELLPPELVWQAALTGEGLRAANRVVCPSAAFAAALRNTYALSSAPAVVRNGRTPLGNHVLLRRQEPRRERLEAVLLPSQEHSVSSQSDQDPAISAGPMHDFAFTAGRLWDAGKNVAVLDRAAARLTMPVKAAGPLAGPHGEAVAFDHLHAVGSLGETELASLLAARPVFVSAARYEPFGLAVLEAAQAGCALVLADIPTFRELWDGAATFAAPDDHAGFAAAIEALIGDQPRRLAQGERAKARAASYTVAAMAAGMAALYRTLLQPRRAAA